MFHIIFEKNSTVMLLIDPDTGSILDANQAAVDFYGYTRKKLCSMTIQEINILQPEELAKEHNKALSEERNYFIFPHRLANGEERIVEVHSSPIQLKKKKVLFSIIYDVTVRQREEDIMWKEKSKYEAIFENAPIGVFQSTPQGQFQRVNPFLAQIYGYVSPEEMIADIKNIDQQIYVRASDRLYLHHGLAKHGEVTEFISEEYRKDGSTIWTLTSARAEKDEYGNILYYEGFITDITDRKLAENALQKANDELEQHVVERTEELTRVNAELRLEIAERRRAEAALRESEEKLRSIIEYATNGIILTDEFGNVVEWNPAQSQLVGVERSEAIGRPLWEIQFQSMAPEQRTEEVHEKIKALVQNMLSTGEIPEHVREQEIKLQRASRDDQFIHSIVFSIKTANGFRLAGISQDATERIQVQMAQQEALERLQKITSRIPGVVFEYRRRPDGSSCLPFASDALNEIYGVSPSEVLVDASKMFEKIHADDYNSVIDSIRISAENITPWKHEFRVKFEDGTIRYLYGNSMPQLEENGSVLWHGFIADITERNQLERELQSQRGFAEQLVDLMGQGLTVTNADGYFEFVNPAYAKLFGYETKDLIGKTPSEVSIPEDHEMLTTQRSLRKIGKTSTYRSHLKRADGIVAPVLITGVPREYNGKFEGTIAVITDLSEQKRIEEELRRTRDELVLLHGELEKTYLLEKQLARIDSLTGINNRRSLFEFAERETETSQRYHQKLSMILFDIDHFKQINDTYGHIIGDQVLIRIAQAVHQELRSMDVIGRYGGDEFIILLPQTSSQEALSLAERIHAGIAKIQIDFDNFQITPTVSIGITQTCTLDSKESMFGKSNDTIESMIVRADKALYLAKQNEHAHTIILDPE